MFWLESRYYRVISTSKFTILFGVSNNLVFFNCDIPSSKIKSYWKKSNTGRTEQIFCDHHCSLLVVIFYYIIIIIIKLPAYYAVLVVQRDTSTTYSAKLILSATASTDNYRCLLPQGWIIIIIEIPN